MLPRGWMVQLRNDERAYGWISIGLHWLSFLMAVGLFAVGLYMVGLTYYDPLYHQLPEWHKLAGAVLALPTLLRLGWVLLNRPPPLLADSPWQRLMARGVHGVLYLLLLALPITGYLITTAEGDALAAFNLTLLPAITTFDPHTVDWAGRLHLWSGWALILVAAVHGLAALKHHFLDRDTTLIRMLKSS